MLGICALTGACQSVVIHIERAVPGATDPEIEFVPLPGNDGHFISLPPNGLTNCIDVLQADAGHHGELDRDACASSGVVVGFLGYTAAYGERHGMSWLTAANAQAAQAAMTALVGYGGVGEPEPITSFLHVSDVQIREPLAKLGGASVSKLLDKQIPSFEHDYDQERYSGVMYAALVATANAELGLPPDPDRPRPRVMIHTGDAVDAGLASEFTRFLQYSNRLDVPWYQVIGNHDVLAFGNLSLHADPRERPDHDRPGHDEFTGDLCGSDWPHCTCTRIADLLRELMVVRREPDNCGALGPLHSAIALLPVVLQRICIDYEVTGDRLVMNPEGRGTAVGAFMAAHSEPSRETLRHRQTIETRTANTADASDALAAGAPVDYANVPPPGQLCATIRGDRPSQRHGFDLRSDAVRGEEPSAASAAPSGGDDRLGPYYCFQLVARDDRRSSVWAVVLDTSSEVGAYGEIEQPQMSWIHRVFASDQLKRDDLILVFGHHPLYDIYDPDAQAELVRVLASDARMVGYFAGHLHRSGVRVVHPDREGSGGHHFWEILAPAVLTYPQQARQVTIKRMGGLGYFEIVSFSARGSGASAALVDRARAGAERDYCHDGEDCPDGKPPAPARRVTYSRLFFRWPGTTPAPAARDHSSVKPGPARASSCAAVSPAT